MQSHTINQLVKINVYNTEADMPHGLALVWQGFIKYLPTIGLILLGLLAMFLIIYIIVNYHKARKFWRNFSIAGALILLFGWGYYGVNQFSMPLTLESDVISIDIIKDTGTMTASTNSKIKVAAVSQGGHNTYAKTSTPSSNVGFLSDTAHAEPEESKIKLFVNDVEITGDKTFVDSSRNQVDDYTILAVADVDIPAGTTTTEVEWQIGDRDWMMSTSNQLSKSDLTHETKTPTNLQFISDATCQSEDTACLELAEQYTNPDGGETHDDNLHRWLNAPNPIRRENIKNIKFENTVSSGRFNYNSNDSTISQSYQDCLNDPARGEQETDQRKEECEAIRATEYGRQNPWNSSSVDWGDSHEATKDLRTNYSLCWDISEHQSGEVIACAIERVRTEEWAGSNLLSTFLDFLGRDYENQCIVDGVPRQIRDSDNQLVTNPDFTTCVTNREIEANIKVHLGVYDIIIRQEDGVSAPSNANGLFYYTGQNTNYCMYGPKTIVDPAMGLVRTIINRVNASGEILPLPAFVNAYSDWKNKIKMLLETDPDYEEVGFWYKLFFGDPNVDHIMEFFQYCHEDFIDTKTTIDLSNFNTDGVTAMSKLFEGSAFANISDTMTAVKDTEWFKTDDVTDMSYMFANISINHAGEFNNADTGLNFDNATTMAGMFKGSRFKKIKFSATPISVKDMSYMFAAVRGEVVVDTLARTITTNGGEVDINNLSTLYVNNMAHMFEYADAKIYASPSKFLTTNVTDMSYMFAGAENTGKALNLQHFITSNVLDMSGMFLNTKFSSVDLSSFDTRKVMGMSHMFEGCDTATLDISSFNTSNVTSMANMFFGTKAETINFGDNFKTGEVTDMSGMFANTIFKPESEFSGNTPLEFDTRKVTSMASMFLNAKNLDFVNVAHFNTSKVQDMSYMFANFHIASQLIVPLDGQEDVASNDGAESNKLYVTDYKDDTTKSSPDSGDGVSLVDYAENPTLGADGTDGWLERFKAMYDAFKRELVNWRSQNPDDYGRNYNTTTNLDLMNFDTSNVLNMEGMFLGAQYPSIKFDNTHFKTDKVKNMAYMFAMINASDLNTRIAELNTESVENMEGMFAGTHLSGELDLSLFKDTKLTNTKFMFAYNKINSIKGTFNACRTGNDSCQYLFEHAESGGATRMHS
jgi:surface protein